MDQSVQEATIVKNFCSLDVANKVPFLPKEKTGKS
jgi:hypothetical protein